jgi:hypothetical protein
LKTRAIRKKEEANLFKAQKDKIMAKERKKKDLTPKIKRKIVRNIQQWKKSLLQKNRRLIRFKNHFEALQIKKFNSTVR